MNMVGDRVRFVYNYIQICMRVECVPFYWLSANFRVINQPLNSRATHIKTLEKPIF